MNTIRAWLTLAAVTLVSVLLLAGLDRYTSQQQRHATEQHEQQSLLALLPPALRAPSLHLEHQPAEPARGLQQPWLLLRADDGHTLAFATIGIARGYGDEIRIQLLSDVNGHPLGTRILSQHETPAYVGGLSSRWFPTPATAREGHPAIDQFSGATLSSRALAAALESAQLQAQRLVQISTGGTDP